MKTITQYRSEIEALMKAHGDIDAKCVLDEREPTTEEITLQGEMLDQVDALTTIIAGMERKERIAAAIAEPAPAMTVPNAVKIEVGDDRASKDTFATLGAQMAAIMNAGCPGGVVDPRLRNIKGAATGLNETVPSDGGFLVQTDFSTKLLEEAFETGILPNRCDKVPISGGANGMTMNGFDETSRASTRSGGIVAYWADEAAEKTATKPKFRQVELKLKKLIGLCYATDENLQDAATLEAMITKGFSNEFGFQLDKAIISGTGAGQPLGIMNAGCLVSVAKEAGQAAATISPHNVMKMRSRLFAASRQNSIWLINQNIEPQLHAMSLAVGTGGAPIYLPANGLSGLPYDTLYGRPVIPIEQCETLGTKGDIILGDFGGYMLAEKGGMQSDMSIHVRFQYDESVFRFVLRIDGQPTRASALTPYKGGATSTQSHFITLDARA